jgi:CMP-N,N'-diacetyllegionaminic acid synthase
MIGQSSVLGLIPARSGSKGVRNKNIREVGGKPLIAWTIAAARTSKYIDRLVLSSDGPQIADVARAHGCDVPFMRPAELATDEADSMSVVRHALATLPERYDFVVLLQPTSPLRIDADIDATLELCVKTGAPSSVSVCQPDKSPYWMMTMADGAVLTPLIPGEWLSSRRQDQPVVYAMNGAVYVVRTERIAAGEQFLSAGTVGYVMPKERSFDIDTELDLTIVDNLLNKGLG